MKKATFDGLFAIEYPDDFEELSPEESRKYFTDRLLRSSFQSKERHMLMSLSKSGSSFLYRLFGLKTVMKNSNANMRNDLKDYEFLGMEESMVLGLPAFTNRFSYLASDKPIKQYGELTVFKIKSVFYAVYCISRFEDKEETAKVFKQFIDSFAYSRP